MNHSQICLFVVYVFTIWCAGVGLYELLTRGKMTRLNHFVFTGEALLLGSMLLVGELTLLSMISLFRAEFLWGVVGTNFLFLFSKKVRNEISSILIYRSRLKLPEFLFGALLLFFIFRNCYFLIDVDSLSTYLYTQKLWLKAGTSLIGGPTFDMRIFNPQYDNIAYSLGLSLFGQETLFPQLVNMFWRVICIILVFGYTTYRLDKYYGLGAALFVMLNDHFLFSGANYSVLLNAAVIAFIFASAYNLWEARTHNSTLHLSMAIIFLSQIVANKLYTIQATVFLFALGLFVQEKPWSMIKAVLKSKRFLVAILLAFAVGALGYVKNLIVTGDLLFPFFSGKMHLLDRAQEQQTVLLKIIGGMSLPKLLKFSSFLFVWPGINPSKYVLIGLLTLPLLMLRTYIRRNKDLTDELAELAFWLSASLLLLIGMCLSAWQDPRPYRFVICVFSFTAVLYLRFVLRNLLNIRWTFVTAGIVIMLSLQGWKIVYANSGGAMYPTMKENVDVLLDRIHMDDVVKKYHPEVLTIRESLRQNPDKFASSAWMVGINTNAFLLPYRPGISLLFSSTIKWDSYDSSEKIIADLDRYGIKWIMMFDSQKKQLQYVTAQEFSKQAIQFDRNPKRTMYDYGFPEELTTLNY